MDLLGKFDFGRVIRMFLPGIIFLSALILIADAWYALVASDYALLKLMAANQPISIALALPLALICGLLVNTIMFVTNVTSLVGPTRGRRAMNQQMVTELMSYGDGTGMARKLFSLIPEETQGSLSLEAFLLPVLSPERIIFIKEYFHFYMHFNIAFCLSITTTEVSIIFWMLVYRMKLGLSTFAFWFLFFTSIFVWVALAALLYIAAKRNYKGNQRVDLSFYLGTLCLVNCFPNTGEAGSNGSSDKGTSLP
jgi:hypothetical protein